MFQRIIQDNILFILFIFSVTILFGYVLFGPIPPLKKIASVSLTIFALAFQGSGFSISYLGKNANQQCIFYQFKSTYQRGCRDFWICKKLNNIGLQFLSSNSKLYFVKWFINLLSTPSLYKKYLGTTYILISKQDKHIKYRLAVLLTKITHDKRIQNYLVICEFQLLFAHYNRCKFT